MELNDVIGVQLGVFLGIVAIVLIFIVQSITRGREMNLIKTRLELFNERAGAMLGKSEELLRQSSARSLLPPEQAVTVYEEYDFLEKTYRFLKEKKNICQRIVSTYVEQTSIILLDSGSTVDSVTTELLHSNFPGVSVYTNNLFAAMHLFGSRRVKLHLLSGHFNHRFAAVYSTEATARLEGFPITLFVLAASRIGYKEGLMVDGEDQENINFKKAALRAFTASADSRLVIAVDASKFSEDKEDYASVMPEEEWSTIVAKDANRITIVTTYPRPGTAQQLQNLYQAEINKFLDSDVKVDSTDLTS